MILKLDNRGKLYQQVYRALRQFAPEIPGRRAGPAT